MKYLFAAILTLLASTAASAQDLRGDAFAGRKVASKQCFSCHAERGPNRAKSGAPTFAAIVKNPTVTAIGLSVFLQTPHAKMPNLILTSREMDDVISYILSFRQR